MDKSVDTVDNLTLNIGKGGYIFQENKIISYCCGGILYTNAGFFAICKVFACVIDDFCS